MTKIIPLTRGLETIVDDEDYDWLSQWSWYATASGYAIRCTTSGPNREKVFLYMHKEILGAGPGEICDHINGNKLDNRGVNLRKAGLLGNARNKRKVPLRNGREPISRYKGVSWQRRSKKWRVQVWAEGIMYNLGVYDSEEEAARVYDRGARHLHAEFAAVNFPHIPGSGLPPKRKQSSVFRGVSFIGTEGCWMAQISVKGKMKYLGRYHNEIDAALAYDAAARRYHGAKARPNFTEGEQWD